MEIDPEILKRYGAGTCSPEEQRLVDAWLAEEDVGVHYPLMAGTEPEVEKAELFRVLDKYMGKRRHRLIWRLAVGVAAAFMVGVVGFYGYRDAWMPWAVPAVTYKTVQVPKGKKIMVVLPDGSKAYLNSGTTLRYAEAFAGPQRLLKLDGEAFFEVVKQVEKPFVVDAGSSRTEVLGTSFNLNNFDNNITALTVESGKVMFTAKGCQDSLLLEHGKRAVYDNGQLKTGGVARYNDSGWKDGHLQFNHHTIAEMVPILERWYDVTITVTDQKLNAYKMRAKYENPSLRRVLEDLVYATDIRYELVGNQVTIYPP